jgi:predicted acylesterase/phospholipase RssA
MPRFCDIVMKGGITSGVVYPAAVVEIAKQFVFKNIGGTSAGAIAAALTAAAERRRALGGDGAGAGFERVAQIPDYLMQNSRLYNLFVPNAGTRSLYHTVVGLFGRARFQPAWLAKWFALVWAYPVAATIGAIPGIAFLVAVIRTYADTALWLWLAALVLALATTAAGMTIAIAIAFWRDFLGKLDANGFGMVTGIDDANRASLGALCTWLAKEMELTAGIPDGTPLTFGMLWDAKRDVAAPGLDAQPDTHDVNLEMITTNVTWGRPYNFPIATRLFFFDPDELRRYFPDYIVDWMVARARKPQTDREIADFASFAPKLPLPAMGDLPVIVATRMSLAFPVLLSAVPLWAVDYTLPPQPDGKRALEHCWFSDGGISSNFPITLFDSPLPRWPTFAINLGGFPPGQKRSDDEAMNVHMIKRNADGVRPGFTRFTALPGFLGAIFSAVQNWNDNTQSVLPGYRDRIVTVYLDADEGGLNLDMPATVLKRLEQRGAAAGALIASRFAAPSVLDPAKPDALGWENHRWLRFRSTMGALKAYLTRFSLGANTPEPPDVRYDALVMADQGIPVSSYALVPPESRAKVSELTSRAATLGDDLAAQPALDGGLPKPSPNLVVRGNLKS